MKHIWSRGLLAGGFVLAVLLLVLIMHRSKLLETILPTVSAPDKTYVNRGPASLTKRATEYSTEEKTEFAKRFNEKFKPVIESWCKAYEDRIPFHPEDVTLDKFHSKLAGGLYTFMIGNTTLTIADSKKGTRVFYMMTHDAAGVLNTLPQNGAPRDLSVPVNRTQVLQMVKADTGIDYQPNQVEIKPSGVACALDGGAFVEVGRQISGGFELLTETSLSFVVGADGKLVAYQH